MSAAPEQLHLVFSLRDWFDLFLHYLSLSLLSIGGAISTAPDMHRFLVDKQHWLTDAQFNASIALAQSAPGPNVLFIALLGWNVGLNIGSMWTGMLGMLVTMTGILIPSTTLTYVASQWGHRNRQLRAVRAFKQGMAPFVIALLLSTSFLLGRNQAEMGQFWPALVTTLITALIVWKTRVHLLWLLGAGAILGWYGII